MITGEDTSQSTFERVEGYISANYPLYELAMNKVEEALRRIKARRTVPHFNVKRRIKSPESTYLKIKKKKMEKEDIENCGITDFAGMRILCIFEQDVCNVVKAVVDALIDLNSGLGLTLRDAILYNYSRDTSVDSDSSKISNALSGLWVLPKDSTEVKERPEYKAKPSGYKSIHIVVGAVVKSESEKQIHIEFQIRTMLQDVWGELEHAIAYKSRHINPHIHESFRTLAQELQAKDHYLRHLKEAADKENSKDSFVMQLDGISRYLDYGEEIVKTIRSLKLHSSFARYVKHMKAEEGLTKASKDSWLKKAHEKLITFEARAAKRTLDQHPDINYVIMMERGYLALRSAKYEEANNAYSNIGKHQDRSIVFFRRGEVALLTGDTVQALKHFDVCEVRLEKDQERCKDNAELLKNIYRTKRRLACVYWYLGRGYIELAIDRMRAAKKLLKGKIRFYNGMASPGVKLDTPMSLSETYEFQWMMVNNYLCYYHVELSLQLENDAVAEIDSGMREKKIRQAARKLKAAEGFYIIFANLDVFNHEHAPSNVYDTAAWYCFHRYRKTKDSSCLDEAKKYCQLTAGRVNFAVLAVTSRDLHQQHLVEIMSTIHIER